MTARADYFLNLAKEFTAFGLAHSVSTGIAFALFIVVLIRSYFSTAKSEQKMKNLPFKD